MTKAAFVVVALGVSAVSSCKGGGPSSTTLEWDDELQLTPDRSVVEIGGDPAKALYAVGNGVFRRDKTTWREISFSGRPRALSAVSVVGDELWAVGRSGAAVHYDGKIWDVERAESEGRSDDLVDVHAWPGEVWATAGKGEIWRRKTQRWESWKPAELGALALGAIWGSAPNRAFIAADSSIAAYDGSAWRVSPVPESGRVRALHGTAADDVWAVGELPRGVRKAALALHFDGKEWKATELGVEQPLASVYARSRQEVYAAGDQGTLVKWDGASWQVVAGLPAAPVVQVFAPAAGPLLVNVDRRRIARAR
jgi:hypothetical protein